MKWHYPMSTPTATKSTALVFTGNDIVDLVRVGDQWAIDGRPEFTIPDTPGREKLGRDRYKGIVCDSGNGYDIKVIRFSDLHRHSDNSLKDGMIKVSDMVSHTEYSGALTDHGNMYGFLEYYKGMKQAGKHPIIGFEAYVETLNGELMGNHLILLAKNEVGYKNLLKLTSESFGHFHKRPHVTWEMLETYHEGVIATSACISGLIPKSLLAGDRDLANKTLQKFKELFGDDFYMEIQRHGVADEDAIMPQLINMARENDVKIIATTDSHYVAKEDAEAHETLLCLQTQKLLSEPHWKFEGTGYHLHTSEEMEQLFADIPEALDNTLEISDKCHVNIKLGDINLPEYAIPEPFKNPTEYFEFLCLDGYKKRFFGTDHFNEQQYRERYKYEIDMIKQMGFVSYFIIVWDFINYARKQNIYVGPGRGSAAGSLIAYCMGITDLDPIKYNLLFERFLNPERVSMPDIDTDFEHTRREEVINYIAQKYGTENVCRIVTFGTMAAKMVLKDVARTLGYPASYGNNLAKMVPNEVKITLKKTFELNPDFKRLYETDKEAKRVIDIALKLEGCKRHASQHACFEAGTMVTTKTGLRAIEDICVGEQVLTHTGNFQPVAEVICTRTDVVYDVYVLGHGVTTVTGNHPLLVQDICTGQREWMPVSQIIATENKIVCHESSGFTENFCLIEKRTVPTQSMYNLTVFNDSSYIANGIVAHNCGLVVAPGKVDNYLPTSMELDTEGNKDVTSQVVMTEVEELSLLKMDLLGLKNMTVIHEVIDRIKVTRGVELEYHDIPLNDRKTYQMLSKGLTGGVFQLESPGMTKVVTRMLADIDELDDSELDQCFERIIAAVALFRPGPMAFIDDYIKGMKNAASIHYDVEAERNILAPTYGVIVYQEQVMQIVQKLAGYTLGRADVVRKAMGKKKLDVMAKEKQVFIHGNKGEFDAGKDKNYAPGCVANGISEVVAEEIWAKMDNFAKYAFNRSHAACYAFIAIITAYMACYYPEEFYAAMLNAFIETDKAPVYLEQAVKRGIKILPPDINKSESGFSVDSGAIRFGLQGLKKINKLANVIFEERKNGEFKDPYDFYFRVAQTGSKPNKGCMEALIYSGAFSCFNPNKKALIKYLKTIEARYEEEAKATQVGQYSLFEGDEFVTPIPTCDDFEERYRMDKEREYVGFYLTKHPVDSLYPMLKDDHSYTMLPDLVANTDEDGKDIYVKTIGLIRNIKQRFTRNGGELYNFTIEDRFCSINCVLFEKRVAANKHRLVEGQVVQVVGFYSVDPSFGAQIKVNDILSEEEIKRDKVPTICVTIHSEQEQHALQAYAGSNPGSTKVAIYYNGKTYYPKLTINLTQGRLDYLKTHFSSVTSL